MPFQAQYLFKAATGSFPSSGDGLKADALGGWIGTDPVKASHLIHSLAFSPAPDGVYSFAKRHSMAMFTAQGEHAHHIKNQGTDQGHVTVSNVTPGGASVVITSEEIGPNESSGNTIVLEVFSSLTPVGDVDGTAEPVDDSDTEAPWDIEFRAHADGVATDSEVIEFDLNYVPDGGPFNPTLTRHYAGTYNDALDDDAIEVEWYDAPSTFGDPDHLVTTAKVWTRLQDFVGQDFTYYMRWRYFGGSWNEYGIGGSVPWVDERSEV